MAELIGSFDIETDFSAYYKEYEAQVKVGVEKCREHIALLPINGRSAPLVGKVVRFQIADGYAEYMVASQKPLQLMHLNVGDGYQIPDAHVRGLNLTDVREMVRAERTINKLFERK